MPTLEWIGKAAVVNHHREVPTHLLQCDPARSVGDPEAGNLLIQGDNLLALKALLPYYAGSVKCIYIDPPYNTGNEGWVYNDNVNSPEMRKWLGQVVGREAEDLSRHDKWLCMMYPRLALLREFLSEDGVIFISIGEDEIHTLRMILLELFGATNSLGTLVWKRRASSAMRGMPLSIDHEYLVVFGKNASQTVLHGLAKSPDDYPHVDELGRYASTDLTVGMGKSARPGQFYVIKNPRTGIEYPPNPERVWRFFPETMNQVIADDLIIWPDEQPEGSRMERPRYKTYFDPESAKPKPVSSWIEALGTNDRELSEEEEEYDIEILQSGMNQEGGKLLSQILGTKDFDYPKPLSLVRSLIRAASRDGDLILDSFAGSGTTGHAVLSMNAEDGLLRKFILVEVEDSTCTNVTAQRLTKAITGYTDPKGKTVEGLGGGFRYCTLGPALFDQYGLVSDTVRFADLAHHVFFAETGSPLPKKATGKSPLIGTFADRAIYLLYNGILGDKSVQGGNVLTSAILESLPAPPGDIGIRVVYGEGTRLGESRLDREGIVFKQIPYGLAGV